MIKMLGKWNDLKSELLKNSQVKEDLDKLENDPEFAILDALVAAKKKGLTQKDIAHKMNTAQSAVSRLKAGKVSPSIDFLNRFAQAIGYKLQISFKPLQ